MEYLLPITPQPALRVRGNSHYTPAKYRNYQKRLVSAIKACGVEPGDYAGLEITFYVPISKSNKSKNVAGDMHRIKPDEDNLLKAFKDCLEKAGIVSNDKIIGAAFPQKYWCGTKVGYIYFELFTLKEWHSKFGKPPVITKEFETL